jgi:hypothetical protein
MPSISAVLACVHLSIVGTPVAPGLISLATREAAAIWRPYGVLIVAQVKDACAGDVVDGVTVVMSDFTPISRITKLPRLGQIAFGGDGTPDPEIVIAVDQLLSLVDAATWSGQPLSHRPVMLRQHAAGRALGRVLAHELGHYMLRTPAHRSDGLMRPAYPIPTLIQRHATGYELAAVDVARLRTIVASKRAVPGAASR